MSTHLDRLPGGIKFVGGELCLDFVNTVGAWVSATKAKRARDYACTPVRDKIGTYKELLSWSEFAGLAAPDEARRLAARAANDSRGAALTLARAAALRLALYRVFKCVVQNWKPESADLDILMQELSIARTHERLRHSIHEFKWTWDQAPDALDRMLWPVARSAADLLTSTAVSQLRQCRGGECGWMFVDTSRNGHRRWCDMKDCGNLAKVRKFRLRIATGTRP